MKLDLPNDIKKVEFFNRRKNSEYIKANIKLILIKEKEVFQLEKFTQRQVFHYNFSKTEIIDVINQILSENFFECKVYNDDFVYGYRITSKGKVLTNKHVNINSFTATSHNKNKNYLLKEGIVVPPLVDLGVMNEEGKIAKSHYDKFKQINRFLEIINDTTKDEKELRIIDFGCGKSYLTFILYYFLSVVKNIKVKILGLDLKEDVIEKCNKIRDKYNYNNLEFYVGNIESYSNIGDYNMIISLHACDTATDYALYHGIKNKVKYIFSVPCCQHEINSQLDCNHFNLLTKYGVLKERFSSILTDSLRANILEYFGYKTQVLEFIDMVHSPKNILIRSVYCGNESDELLLDNITECLNYFNIEPTLYRLLFKD